MILIVVPYVFVVLIFIGSMIGGVTHWCDFSFGEDDSHTICITCSNGSMGGDMDTTTKHLFLYEVGHGIDWCHKMIKSYSSYMAWFGPT